MLLQESLLNTITVGHCKSVLEKITPESIQLTITSPPYRNAIDYDMHVSKNGGYYRGRLRQETSDYLSDMIQIFNESIFRVTKEGGYCCIVIGNELVNGTLLPLPHMLLSRLVEPYGKWNLHEEIIWHKVTGGTNRYGSFVINPYPKYYRANIMHEFILVLRKGNVNSGRNQRRDALPATHEEWTKEIANSVWHIAPVPPGYINHPCPFPEEIPYRLISCIFLQRGHNLRIPSMAAVKPPRSPHILNGDISEWISSKIDVKLKEPRERLKEEGLHIRPNALIANWRKIPSHFVHRLLIPAVL